MKQNEIPTMAVFGHPNHELALFGIVQRWKPAILILTDGGGPYRATDTLKGLAGINHQGPIEILPFKEESLYRALLKKDVDFFRSIASIIRERAVTWDAHRIICDAVEFFNPIHDIVRPLVDIATRGIERCELLEAPITYQRSGPGGAFEFQRPLDSRKAEEIRITLTEGEYKKKVWAWEEVYVGLRELIGPLVGDGARFRFETLVKGRRGIPIPNGECAIHYESRGEDLRKEGKVGTVITHEAHYQPLVKAIL